ncbi:rCG58105 [Rattus norvegicus]|uniref:RCG58105 n=1 Tax=Rattus norvegicus TaxID=10116 RepID=A6J4V7_RAT|nr:rCG58105 [Rattus norvegicus]
MATRRRRLPLALSGVLLRREHQGSALPVRSWPAQVLLFSTYLLILCICL